MNDTTPEAAAREAAARDYGLRDLSDATLRVLARAHDADWARRWDYFDKVAGYWVPTAHPDACRAAGFRAMLSGELRVDTVDFGPPFVGLVADPGPPDWVAPLQQVRRVVCLVAADPTGLTREIERFRQTAERILKERER